MVSFDMKFYIIPNNALQQNFTRTYLNLKNMFYDEWI